MELRPCRRLPLLPPQNDPSRPADYFEKPHHLEENLTMTCIVGIKVRGRMMGSPVAQQHRVMPAMLAVQRRAAALSLAKRLTWLSLSPPVSPAGPCAQGGARRGAHLPARRHHCAHGHRRQHPHRAPHRTRVRAADGRRPRNGGARVQGDAAGGAHPQAAQTAGVGGRGAAS